ncbi:MAG: cell division protein FtsZ, partial [Zestosphaera sp.]
LIQSRAHPDANIIWGMVIDPNLVDTVRITVIATGLGESSSSTFQQELKQTKAEGALNFLSRKFSLTPDDSSEIPTFLRKN